LSLGRSAAGLSPRAYGLALGLAAACVIAAAWTYTALMPMAYLESGYAIWAAKQDMLRGCQFNDVLIMGDSRIDAAIDPTHLPVPATNLALGGTTPLETRYFAEAVTQCPKLPKLVIYAHSMLAFLKPNEYFWTDAARYGYITFAQLRQAAALAAQLHDPTLAAVNTHDGLSGIVRDIVYGIHFPSIYMASVLESRGFGRRASNMKLLRHTIETNGQVKYGDTAAGPLPGPDSNVKSFVPSPLEAASFTDTVAMFTARGVPVLILATPVSQATFQATPPRVLAQYQDFLADAVRRHPNALSAPPRVAAWPNAYFVDGKHLNTRGEDIFTRRVAACLLAWRDNPGRPAPCDPGSPPLPPVEAAGALRRSSR
jgi:hypothetical protein